jgi:hypothetical protein
VLLLCHVLLLQLLQRHLLVCHRLVAQGSGVRVRV